MNTQGTNAALVQRVRTFADDMRRAKAESGVILPIPKAAVPDRAQAPVPQSAVPEVRNTNSIPQKPLPKDSAPLEEFISSQKPPATILRQPFAQTSHLADEQTPLDIRQEAGDNMSQEGTIITDTRRKRWTLGKALNKSLTTWFDEQKKEIALAAERKAPEPNVPPVETRAQVVQAARQKSALAPQDDRHVVVEKLRTFARDAKRITGKSYTTLHQPTGAKVIPTWSSASDDHGPTTAITPQTPQQIPPLVKQARRTIRPTGIAPQAPKSLEKDVAPIAEQTLPEHVFVERKEKKIQPLRQNTRAQYGMVDDVAPVAVSTPSEEETSAPEPLEEAASVDQETLDARHEAIERLLAMRRRREEEQAPVVPKPRQRSVPPPPPPAPVSRDIAFTPPAFAATKTSNFRTYRNDAIDDIEQHKRSIPNIAGAEASRRSAQTPPRIPKAHSPAQPFIVAGIIMISIIAIGGVSLFLYARQSKEENTTSASVPTFISIDRQKSVPFSTNRATLLQTLESEVRISGTGITQIYPTKTDTPGAGAISTSEFMYVLDPRAPGSFIRNLSEEMMFGTYDGGPFFILKTAQFDTTFAGMLDWEQYMSADLTPLFGSPVTRTRDATLRIVDQTRNAFFIDDTIQNTDVRILYDDTGRERLLYAFPDKNTIVITTSSAAMVELIRRLE
jgi:hypothetical protein